MRTFSRFTRALSLVLGVTLPAAAAQANDQLFLNQNTTGLALPGVTIPGGHDEVRAADGTTCRSAVSGNGAYLDAGVIGNGNNGRDNGAAAAYGRVVIPLGAPRNRIDCQRLYDLEIQRLKAEIDLLRAGGGGVQPVQNAGGGWASEGWTN